MTPTFVYVIRFGRYVKVGWSQDPHGRMRKLRYERRLAHPVDADMKDCEVLGWIPGAESLERKMHHVLKEYRVRGEFFLLPESLMAALATLRPGSMIAPPLAEVDRDF